MRKKFLVVLFSVLFLTGVCQAADYSWEEYLAFFALTTTSFTDISVLDDERELVADQQIFIYRMHRIRTPEGDDFAVYPWQKGIVATTNPCWPTKVYTPYGRYFFKYNNQSTERACNGFLSRDEVSFDYEEGGDAYEDE